MLQARHYHNFKGCENCILIIGDAEGYRAAHQHLESTSDVAFVSSRHISLESTNEIDGQILQFSDKEKITLSEIYKKLSVAKEPAHYYFNIDNAPHIDFLISCGEYPSLP